MKNNWKNEIRIQFLLIKYNIVDFFISLKEYINKLRKVQFHNEHYCV